MTCYTQLTIAISFFQSLHVKAKLTMVTSGWLTFFVYRLLSFPMKMSDKNFFIKKCITFASALVQEITFKDSCNNDFSPTCSSYWEMKRCSKLYLTQPRAAGALVCEGEGDKREDHPKVKTQRMRIAFVQPEKAFPFSSTLHRARDPPRHWGNQHACLYIQVPSRRWESPKEQSQSAGCTGMRVCF